MKVIQSDNCAEMLIPDSGDLSICSQKKTAAHCIPILHTDMHIFIMLCTHSPVVKVARRCLLSRQWTAVDFSGCTVSSPKDQTLLVFSLWATVVGSTPEQALAMINASMLEEKV